MRGMSWKPTELELRTLAVITHASWEERAELLRSWREGRLRELAEQVAAHERAHDGAGEGDHATP